MGNKECSSCTTPLSIHFLPIRVYTYTFSTSKNNLRLWLGSLVLCHSTPVPGSWHLRVIYFSLDIQFCLSGWTPFIIGEEMPKHPNMMLYSKMEHLAILPLAPQEDNRRAWGWQLLPKIFKNPVTNWVVLAAAHQDTARLVLSCLPCAPCGLEARVSAQRQHLWKSERDSWLHGAPDQGSYCCW